MKTLLTLVFIYMLCSEVFQASTALWCYQCDGFECDAKSVNCSAFQDTCYTSTVESQGLKYIQKGCTAKAACGLVAGLMKCCNADLCNGAEGVKLSLLIMLVPLVSSILFL